MIPCSVPGCQSLEMRQSFWRLVLQNRQDGCSFKDEEGVQCGATPKVLPQSRFRSAFVGCSDWKKGGTPTRLGGLMARRMPAGVYLELLSSLLDTGVEKLKAADTCTVTATKCSRYPDCKRHEGECPALLRAGSGPFLVHAEVYTPREMSDDGKVRVLSSTALTATSFPYASREARWCTRWWRRTHLRRSERSRYASHFLLCLMYSLMRV